MARNFLFAILLAGCAHWSSSPSGSAGDAWRADQFTDPAKYKEGNKTNPPFRFLVVAIMDPDNREIDHEVTEVRAKSKNKYFDPSKAIDLMKTPERVANKPLISGSVIDNQRFTSWAYSGFVLEVPVENLVAASAGDLGLNDAMIPGTPEKDVKAAIASARRKFGLPTPADLLSRTNVRKHNEVAFVGRSRSGSEVKIVGAFIKAAADNGADLCSPQQCARVRDLAAKHGWPVVKIFQPRPVSKKKKGQDSTDFSF